MKTLKITINCASFSLFDYHVCIPHCVLQQEFTVSEINWPLVKCQMLRKVCLAYDQY